MKYTCKKRNWPRNLSFALAFSFTLAVGCTDTSTPEGFCDQLVKNECHINYQCCNASERLNRANIFLTHSTEEECVEEYRKLYCPSFTYMAEADEEGRIEWDASAASSCK